MKPQEILKTLKAGRSFLISTHINPDPDALTSELVMALFLKSLGKRVTILNEKAMPQRFSFFPRSGMVKRYRPGQTLRYDTAVILDCGDLERVGAVKSLIRLDKPLINIDHHITNTFFGSGPVVRPQASSTAEIIYDLLRSWKFQITRDIALLLYLGIMTDTGSFRYENTSAHTHEVTSHLMEFDFSVPELHRRIYESIPLEEVHQFVRIIERIQPLAQGRIVCIELSRKTVRKFSESFDLRDKIFRYLRAIEGVEVVIIFTEEGVRATRVNFRSHETFDVARLAMHFQGGGHPRASGCLLKRPMKEAKQMVLKEVKKRM